MSIKWIVSGRGPLMAAALLPLVSCGVRAREQSSESQAASSPPPSSALQPVQAAAFNPVSRPARRISRQKLGEQYCLVRTVEDGQGSSRTLRLPVVGVPNADEWVTINDIELESVDQQAGNCGSSAAKLPGDRMRIEPGPDGNRFEVSIRAGTTVLASATFSRPVPGAHYGSDGFLFSRKACISSSGNCGVFGEHDFYLYIVDVARNARSDVSKLVLLEWFDPENMRSECHAERPETSMRRRVDAGVCDVPAWIPDSFGWPSDLEPALKGMDVPVYEKQTGTGGGYEPPG